MNQRNELAAHLAIRLESLRAATEEKEKADKRFAAWHRKTTA